MRKLFILLLLPAQLVLAQNEVSLDSCYQWARENYPNLKQAGIFKEITALQQENINTNYYPQVTLNGQATYQSDVTHIGISLPNISIPTVSKDQYKVYAELKQSIWDGGISAANRELENAVLGKNLSELEMELYKLNDQVSQAFFTALVIDKQLMVIEAQKKVLEEKLSSVESGVKNGMVEKSSALVIKAEILNLDQSQIQLQAGKSSVVKMLSVMTGKDISENSKLNYTSKNINVGEELQRPELNYYASQSRLMDSQIALLDKTRNPKLFGFGQAGYGRPGMNMLNDKFDSWYLVGVGVSWNAFDWKNTTRKKEVIHLQQTALQYHEEVFRQNIQVLDVQQKETIGKLENMISNDQTLVDLRSEIAKTAASKLENQVITASDYIGEVQAETLAKLNFELHKIQLDEAKEKYELIIGKGLQGEENQTKKKQ
ncbi:MAG TPA: TolC family protein [Draconibacterium sp.]|nr:TolC family protein [Draconibacterium sp.]